ncbi:MAG: uL15 family ribosomal protein [Candidatus Diapherotrites archaeon]|nr:uL15 family ribosomal protein [Candidatus Diapherotrites archaeon]
MVLRKERKRNRKNKYRGHRLHGKGDTKHSRGAGSKGGKGRANSFGAKFSKYYKELYSGHGIILNPKKKGKTMNLEDIVNQIPAWIKEGKVVQEKEGIVIDGSLIGINKILGRGTVAQKLIIRNISLTEKAKEKIQTAQGIIDGISESAEEETEENTEE